MGPSPHIGYLLEIINPSYILFLLHKSTPTVYVASGSTHPQYLLNIDECQNYIDRDETGGKFSTGVNDTGGNLPQVSTMSGVVIVFANFRKSRISAARTIKDLGEDDS